MKTALSVLLALNFAGQVLSWSGPGHLLVAKVAYDKLSKSNPQALNKANALLEVLSDNQPQMITKEYDYPFVECATFADDIKSQGGTWQSGWHFINLPYFDEGGKASDFGDYGASSVNITSAMQGIMDWIGGKNGYKNHFVYQTIMQHVKTENEGKSYALRLLIHYAGDIAQPLHCATKVDSEFPKGDRGGNNIYIKKIGSASNLHSLWDSVITEFSTQFKLPFSDADWNKIEGSVDTLMQKYQISQSEYQTTNFMKWSQDAFQIAQSNAWKNIEENQAVPTSYLTRTKPLAERQIVLGGYRLAYLITQLFGVQAEEDFSQ